MSYETINTLMHAVERMLSQTSGTAVQLYSEDRIVDSLIDAFKVVFPEAWWPGLMVWEQKILDGSTGIVTTDFENITRYEDIRAVFWNQTDRQLVELSRSINPYRLTGTQGQYIEGIETSGRLLRVLPAAATGTIEVHGRVMPTVFTLDTVLKVDPLVLKFWAAWDYSTDDGANPAQEDKWKRLFEARLAQLKAEYSSKPMAVVPNRTPSPPTDWSVV